METVEEAQAYGRGLLVGERVRLRPLREDDLPLLAAWWEDPEQQVLQQQAVRPRPAGANTDMHRRWSANADTSGAGFSVETLDGGAFVGHATLWGAALPVRDATFAMLIAPEQQGRGYGTEAARLMVRYGFLAMGLNRIELRTYAFPRRTACTPTPSSRRNRLRGPPTRARRAYASAGFVEEGVRREAVWIDGGFADEVVMAILRREWTP